MANIWILHTADLHNRLCPAAARQLGELRREHDAALLLDAGDAVAAGNLTFRLGGEPILKRMAETGYDAMAMGNRESHPTRRLLERKLRDADFPVLAANIVAKRQPLPSIVRDHLVVKLPDGFTVAVVGLAPQMTRPESRWARVTDYVFEDPVRVARDLAGELRGETDLVVCLSHCGEEVDHRLAAMPEVDLVLGGHSHRHLVAYNDGEALVAHPGFRGSHVALTRIGRRDDAESMLIPLASGA
jgi:2',3'-cyclic-nucleotide 2'-phosphodiesterase (5'-nucleotidase family)